MFFLPHGINDCNAMMHFQRGVFDTVLVMVDRLEDDPWYWDDSGLEGNFAFQMKDQREARGWSQTEFAKRLSARGLPFHQTTIQRIETGRRPLKLTESIIIAEVLGTKFETMLRAFSVTMAYSELTDHLRPGEFEYHVRSADDVAWRAQKTASLIRELVDQYRLAVEQTPGAEIDDRVIQVANECIRLNLELHPHAEELARRVREAESEFGALPREYPSRSFDDEDEPCDDSDA